MRVEHVLDLQRREVLAPAAEHLLAAAREGVRPVRVHGGQVAGAQPAVGRPDRGRLRWHPPVPGGEHRIPEQDLPGLARRQRRPALRPGRPAIRSSRLAVTGRHDLGLVDRAQVGMLTGGAERPVGPAAVRPDQTVRGLGHRIPDHDLQAEPPLDLLMPAPLGRRARVTQPQRGAGVVWPLGLAHQDLQHGADRVELGGPVPPRDVQEAAGREPWHEHQAGPAGQRSQHRVDRRVDVEQRQGGHQPVGRGQPHPEREPLGGHRVRPVRLHDQLGPPRRARCRDQHGQVARAHRPRRGGRDGPPGPPGP